MLDLQGVLPTVLRSAGNQLQRCACGCRGRLGEHRLKDKGLLGTLIPLGDDALPIAEQEMRYLHPTEMMLLQGGAVMVDFKENLRLGLAGVGQCVSPLMGQWIASHVRKLVDRFVAADSVCDPHENLQNMKKHLLLLIEMIWTPLASSTEVAVVPDIRASENLSDHFSVSVHGDPFVRVPCAVGQVRAAEAAIHPDIFELQACTEEGSDMSDDRLVHPGGDIMFVPRACDRGHEDEEVEGPTEEEDEGMPDDAPLSTVHVVPHGPDASVTDAPPMMP